MLTESQVHRSFLRLFQSVERDEATYDKAEQLLENLRPESPLLHRLTEQLEELRATAAAQQADV